MVKLGSRFVAALFLASLPLAAAPVPRSAPDSDPDAQAVYIVQLEEPPLARARAGTGKLDLDAPESRRALDLIRDRQDAALAAIEGALGRALEPLYRYAVAFDGMAIAMTGREAEALAGLPGVARVQPGTRLHITSDAGPAWTGATTLWSGTGTGGLPGTKGEGMVIGILDTGIKLDHPSFADTGGDGYNHANPRGAGNYVGWCRPGNPNYDPSLACNDKLIGVWSWPDSGADPRDDQGHGTHTASIAAGNHVTATLGSGIPNRPISGVAPHANLISYDICGSGGYCENWVVIAAIDQAVADGVDVISLALTDSYGGSSPWYNSVAQALLGARQAGIFVAASLGENWGEIGSPANAPWLLGVAAVSHDRRFVSSLAGLAGGSNPPPDLRSSSLTSSFGPTLILEAGDYGSYDCSSPFPAGTFHGEIVVCYHYYYDSQGAQIVKGQNVLAAGGGGMVLAQYYSYGTEPDAVPNVLPAVLLSPDDSSALWSWLSSGSGHSGRIVGTAAQLDPLFADRLWPGSPVGPDYYSFYDTMKPDVAAPGREILAAHTTGYRILSGTSMAAAHAAGAAALLTALHPGWTPAEIQSALTLTGAGVVEDDGSATNPLETGGGRLDLSAAARTGLVLDETPAHFDAADPSQGGSPKTLNLAGLADGYCVLSCGWARTVRSTLATPTQWTVTVESPAGVGLTVSPLSFSLPPGGTQILQITATGTTSVSDWQYGRVTLSETGAQAPAVHLPLAAFFVPQYQLTAQKGGSGTGRVTSVPAGIDCGSDCTEYYPENSYVTLTAAADPGSVFVGWGGDCYGIYSTCQISIYSQRLVTAYFNPPAPDKPLANQVPFKDSLNGPVSGGTWKYYFVDLPSGTDQLVVDVFDLDASVYLYVRHGTKPSFDGADCIDYSYYTPNRRCVLTQPASGRWWIGVVNGDNGVTIRYSIRASWGSASDRQLANRSPVSDYVSAPAPGAAWKYYFFDVAAGGSDLAVDLSLLSADADLYLRRGAKPDRSNSDCSSIEGSTLPELCRIANPTPGRWWVGVNNFSAGTVAYTLKASWQTVDVATDFHTVTPCRLFDSRDGQPLSSGAVRTLQATGACQIPATARALSANVTIVGPTGNGRLVLYPADEGAPLSSTINFQTGQTRGNNALLKLDGAGALSALATVLGDGSVHVVVDVNGYFAEP